ncbi:MAG: YbjQ family protein [Planctomycetota bacterium]|jgi:uncharacterized protein YbjQ (UPF0145 family)
MNDVRIFTTPILDGIKIREYKDIVIVRNVSAINIVKDIMTRVRDVIGGRSGSYQDAMKKMEKSVLDEVKAEARKKGANAIVDFSLDYDSIDGLLMASAKGTAVVIED